MFVEFENNPEVRALSEAKADYQEARQAAIESLAVMLVTNLKKAGLTKDATDASPASSHTTNAKLAMIRALKEILP